METVMHEETRKDGGSICGDGRPMHVWTGCKRKQLRESVRNNRKRTKLMTNSWWIAQELQKQCDGTHKHVQLLRGKAKLAAEYPKGLCRAICRGLMREKKQRVMGIRGVAVVEAIGKNTKLPDRNEHHGKEELIGGHAGEMEAWDDVSRVKLDAQKVTEARKEEMYWFRKKKVYHKITGEEAKRKGWNILQIRWVDINKGDEENPVYRSRLVAKEFRKAGQEETDWYAGTPPLQALKMIISDVATGE